MSEIPKDVKRRLFENNPILCCWMNDIFTYLSVAAIIVGIVSDAINMKLGLVSTNWFVLAIGFWMLGIFAWFRGYFSAKEK